MPFWNRLIVLYQLLDRKLRTIYNYATAVKLEYNVCCPLERTVGGNGLNIRFSSWLFFQLSFSINSCEKWINKKFVLLSSMSSVVEPMQYRQLEISTMSFLSFFLACGFLTGNQSIYHAFRIPDSYWPGVRS